MNEESKKWPSDISGSTFNSPTQGDVKPNPYETLVRLSGEFNNKYSSIEGVLSIVTETKQLAGYGSEGWTLGFYVSSQKTNTNARLIKVDGPRERDFPVTIKLLKPDLGYTDIGVAYSSSELEDFFLEAISDEAFKDQIRSIRKK